MIMEEVFHELYKIYYKLGDTYDFESKPMQELGHLLYEVESTVKGI